jgi:hypothetical protein
MVAARENDMRASTWIGRSIAATAVVFNCMAADAAPVTLTYEGSVTSYSYIDLSAGLPLGAAVSLSLTFNDTFSDGSYDFSDNLGPVSGSMTVGSASYAFNGVTPFSYGFDGTGGVTWVQPMFTGSGPQINGGSLFGLFMQITPAMTLLGDLALGYGYTTQYPDGGSSTAFGYANITADRYDITPVSVVPTPGTLPLVMAALFAAGWVRRRA